MKVTIEKMPPIASGSFDVRPLTIFIGPNNTGKTRAGLLVYALAKALESPFNSGRSSLWPAGVLREEAACYDPDRQSVPEALAEHALFVFQVAFPLLVDDLLGLDSAASSSSAASVSVETNAGKTVVLRTAGNRSTTDLAPFQDLTELAAAWEQFGDRRFESIESQQPEQRFWRAIRTNRGLPAGAAYYLPAGRGALAESWGFLLENALDGASSARSAHLTRRVGDYLGLLLRAAQRAAAAKPGDFRLDVVVDLIEREILHGRIATTGSQAVPLPLVFSNIFADEADRYTIDLGRASSSVNEVGPLAMILKSIVSSGDLIVLDEPEAHLHPENQRRIAHALVRLANAGVTIIAPTHSHTIVHEVSDMIRANRLGFEKAAELGYDKSDLIDSSKAGLYVFRDEESGARIEEVPFDDEFGYPEETFFEVAQDQMFSSHRLDIASLGTK